MKILILTSGGDGPGMNKFIAQIYRAFKHDAYAVKGGFKGLIEGDVNPLSTFNPSAVAEQAGSCVYSSRCPEFASPKGFKKGLNTAKAFDVVIILGGNGSFNGAKQLAANGVRTVFVPATIDNDVDISDYSIGFHTAVKACCDFVYNTMPSMQAFERCCVFEVMGRKHDAIAENTSKIVEADALINSKETIDFKKVGKIVKNNKKLGNASCVIIRENILPIEQFVDKLSQEAKNVEIKGVKVGYLQRGTKPTKFELKVACKLAKTCIKSIKHSKSSFACTIENGKVKVIKF